MSSDVERNAITRILQACENPVIIDLGSYLGEDAEWMSQACTHRPTIIMVEADPENFKSVANVAKRLNATAIHGAIADFSGDIEFWACYTPDGRGSGSIRKPTGHLKEKPWYDFRKLPEKIPCFRLDEIAKRPDGETALDHVDVLWVDIQGAENSMIAGGQKTLAVTRYLFIEAEKRILYDGQAIREDLLATLPGWTIIGDFDFNLLLKRD